LTSKLRRRELSGTEEIRTKEEIITDKIETEGNEYKTGQKEMGRK
jgi:hypothetical protein